MKTTITLAAAVTTLLAGACNVQAAIRDPIKDNGTTCFNGYGYDLDSGEYRYTAHNEQTRSNGKLTHWSVVYVGRSGDVIARKTLDFRANQTVPVYTLDIPAGHYKEGIRHHNGQWTMIRKKNASSSTERKKFKIDPPMAGDAGFNSLVRQHFATLMHGKTFKFRFAAAGKQSVLNLKASKIGKTTFEGHKAVVFKAELDMFLVHFFVGSLKLTYNPSTRRLLEYRGIGNLHDTKGHTYSVRVDYYSDMPAIARDHGAPAPECGSMQDDDNGSG